MSNATKTVNTTGELRQLLAELIIGLKEGTVKPEIASGVTKMAAQINESIYSEIKASRFVNDTGGKAGPMGKMNIGSPG